MSISNHTIEHQLMQVRRLKLEHLIDTSPADLVRSNLDLLAGAISPAKRSANQLLTILVKEVKGLSVGTG